jgi:hypothetical protein
MNWYPEKKCKPKPKWDEMGYVTSMPWRNYGYEIVDVEGGFKMVPFSERVWPDGRVERCP